MICQHCGTTISDAENFCTSCGMPQEEGAPVQQTIRPIKLNLAQLLGDTFTLYGRHFGIMCVTGLIVMGVQTFFDVCGAVTKQVFLFSIFFGILASCYTWIMVIRQCLYTARGGAGFLPNLMVVPLMTYLKMIGLVFVTLCITFGFSMLLATPFAVIVFVCVFLLANSFANALGAAVMTMCIAIVVMMFYPIVRLWLPYCFLVDRNMGIIDSVQTSWRIMSWNFWALFAGLFVVLACWCCWIIPCSIVSQFLLGWDEHSVQGTLLMNFGSIFLAPLMYLVSVLAYLQLTGESHRELIEKHADTANRT
jgi:hypothetical protein